MVLTLIISFKPVLSININISCSIEIERGKNLLNLNDFVVDLAPSLDKRSRFKSVLLAHGSGRTHKRELIPSYTGEIYFPEVDLKAMHTYDETGSYISSDGSLHFENVCSIRFANLVYPQLSSSGQAEVQRLSEELQDACRAVQPDLIGCVFEWKSVSKAAFELLAVYFWKIEGPLWMD
jgi:hypothetical protein